MIGIGVHSVRPGTLLAQFHDDESQTQSSFSVSIQALPLLYLCPLAVGSYLGLLAAKSLWLINSETTNRTSSVADWLRQTTEVRMSFELLLCCVIAVYGLFNFVALPRLTKTWNASRSMSKVAKAGVLAAVQFVRDVTLVATILYSCFALLTLFLRFGFFGNAELLKWAVTSADGVHESLEKVSDFWDHWFFLFPLAILAFTAWLKQRKDFVGRFERFVDEEFDRLNEERTREPERWNQLPADDRLHNMD
jgi:hypothetical protein